MSRNLISASIVFAVLALWLGSGALSGNESAGPEASAATVAEPRPLAAQPRAPERVRVALIDAELRDRTLTLRGRTVTKRSVDVKSELSGRIVSRPVER